VTRRIAIAAPATGDDEWRAARGPIERGWLTQGPEVAAFEEAMARRVGAAHAVATSSGTTALHLALAALGVGPGDEVVLPSFTWVATANAVLHCGGTPVLVDVEAHGFNIDAVAAARAVTPRTRAIIAVHQFGLCADVDALSAAAPGVAIVEDAACAAGAELRGRAAGSLGRAAIFSFHPRKTITCGEGGMITTADPELAARARSLRNHGASPPEPGAPPHRMADFDVVGFNHRMTDVQAAIGRVQLGKLDRFIAERDAFAAQYRRELAGVGWLRTPDAPADARHGWQSFVCTVLPGAPLTRDALMAALEARGVGTRPGTHAVHTLGHIRARLGELDLPVSRACAERTIALPLHNRMTADDVAHVAEQVRAVG
jgi:dTDP-4-amino-4,6-dideoxygalactose transaminase